MDNFREFLEKLFVALGIELPAESATLNEVWEIVEEKLKPVTERMAEEAVDQALALGAIRSDERNWAFDFLREHGLSVFRSFAEARARQVEGVATFRRFAESRLEPTSDLQRSINRQLGISEAVFLKYNPAPDRDPRPDRVQAEINRQCGVSEELFARYYPDA
jgi:hypothetical protein